MFITDGYRTSSQDRVVLFPFDDHAFPFQSGVRLRLNGYRHRPSRIVLGLGEPGSSDCRGVTYYGTVCRVDDELWMWYLGMGGLDEGWHERMHLAVSTDGVNWGKPDLGLVEYNASKDNNLVHLSGAIT